MDTDLISPRLFNLIKGIFSLVFGLALFISVVMIIYVGIIYITGDKEGTKKVHKIVPYLILALALTFLSRLIPSLIKLFFE